MSSVTTGFPVAHSTMSGCTICCAALVITAYTSAPLRMSSRAISVLFMAATLPVMQSIIFLSLSSVVFVPMISFDVC